jgi:hypothetical protein
MGSWGSFFETDSRRYSTNTATYNTTTTQQVSDAYNSTSNVAHNVSGSGNTYNAYSFGAGGENAESLLNSFAVPYGTTATGTSQTSLLKVLAIPAVLVAVMFSLWLYFRKR